MGNLGYADDICLLSHPWAEMQDKLNDLAHEANKSGLTINVKKTKSTLINIKTEVQIPILVNA